MLEYFQVSHKTDGKTVCKIYVDLRHECCDGIVLVDDVIVGRFNEKAAEFRGAQWGNIPYWESRAATIAKHYSPFWQGKTAN